MGPLELLADAVHQARAVTIRTLDGTQLSGEPLHVGPRSVWIVVANTDVFIPLDQVHTVETAITNPAGDCS